MEVFNKQLEHCEVNNKKNKLDIVVILDGVNDPLNIGSIFRIMDSFGASELCLCDCNVKLPNKNVNKTSRATEKYIKYSYFYNTIEAVEFYKSLKYKIIALEITNNAKLLMNYSFNEKTVIIVGAEDKGVSQNILNLVDDTVFIPMFGQNTSMNVANSLGICLYELVRQRI